MLSISTPDVYAKDSECEYSDVVFRTHPDQEGEPTLVSVGLFLIDISNVNDTDQSFMANISIRITWKDPRLARAQHDHETVCVVELAKVWNPQVRIQNERAVWKRLADVVEIEADGTVTYTQRFNGTYASVGDIKQFPFAIHGFSLLHLFLLAIRLMRLYWLPTTDGGEDLRYSLFQTGRSASKKRVPGNTQYLAIKSLQK